MTKDEIIERIKKRFPNITTSKIESIIKDLELVAPFKEQDFNRIVNKIKELNNQITLPYISAPSESKDKDDGFEL